MRLKCTRCQHWRPSQHIERERHYCKPCRIITKTLLEQHLQQVQEFENAPVQIFQTKKQYAPTLDKLLKEYKVKQ